MGVTNNQRLRSTFCTGEANTDRHEASRGLFATAVLLGERTYRLQTVLQIS